MSQAAQAGYHASFGHIGWEFVYVAIDDATHLAYVEVLTEQKATTVVGFCAAPRRS